LIICIKTWDDTISEEVVYWNPKIECRMKQIKCCFTVVSDRRTFLTRIIDMSSRHRNPSRWLEERGYRARSTILFATLKRIEVGTEGHVLVWRSIICVIDLSDLLVYSIPARRNVDECSCERHLAQWFFRKRDAICHDPPQIHKFEIRLKISERKSQYYILTRVR